MQSTLNQDQRNRAASATKRRILEAAEEVMSQKGFASSLISEIARKANVADSVIYHYFKSKQDLLFSVPGEKLKVELALLNEHLAGIPDVLSQLRKVIWMALWYDDMHKDYARLLLIEYRSFEAYYSSPCYEMARQYSRIVSSILDRGVKEGRFRSDIPVRIIRDVVLGALDMETISCLTTGEVASGVSDFEYVVDLVDSMVEAKGPPEGHRVSRLDSIIEAAKKVFAEKEFARATISDIAGLAGVADGTIYEYFQSKEDILLSIAEDRFGSYLAQVAGAFDIKRADQKLRRLIEYHFSCFASDREFLKLFLMRLQASDKFYTSKAFEIYRSYCGLIEEIIEEGKAAGVFRPTVNARVFRNMFMGAFTRHVHSMVRVRQILPSGQG